MLAHDDDDVDGRNLLYPMADAVVSFVVSFVSFVIVTFNNICSHPHIGHDLKVGTT